MAHLEWKQDPLGLVKWLRFDAIRTVEIQQHAQVTRHPVQKGADIADHVRVEQPHVSVTAVISIAPLTIDAKIARLKDVPIPSGLYQPVALPSGPIGYNARALQSGLLDAAVDALSSAVGPSVIESLVTNSPGDRASEAATELLKLQDERTMIRLVDELQTYEDMVLVSVIGTRTQQFYGAAFQLELERIKIVSTSLVDLPVPLEPRGQVAKKTASAPKAETDNPVAEAKKSAALRIAEGLFSLGGP